MASQQSSVYVSVDTLVKCLQAIHPQVICSDAATDKANAFTVSMSGRQVLPELLTYNVDVKSINTKDLRAALDMHNIVEPLEDIADIGERALHSRFRAMVERLIALYDRRIFNAVYTSLVVFNKSPSALRWKVNGSKPSLGPKGGEITIVTMTVSYSSSKLEKPIEHTFDLVAAGRAYNIRTSETRFLESALRDAPASIIAPLMQHFKLA